MEGDRFGTPSPEVVRAKARKHNVEVVELPEMEEAVPRSSSVAYIEPTEDGAQEAVIVVEVPDEDSSEGSGGAKV